MANYYISSSGSNTAPYDTWAKAASMSTSGVPLFKGINAIFTAVAAGDKVYVANNTTPITLANNILCANTTATGVTPITIIGVPFNSTTENGVCAEFKNYGFTFSANANNFVFRNIQVTNAVNGWIDTTYNTFNNVWINCRVVNSSGIAFNGMIFGTFVHCLASGCSNGWSPAYCRFWDCEANSCTNNGFDLGDSDGENILVSCTAYNNGYYSFYMSDNDLLIGCCADSYVLLSADSRSTLIGCAFGHNAADGLFTSASSSIVYDMYSVYPGTSWSGVTIDSTFAGVNTRLNATPLFEDYTTGKFNQKFGSPGMRTAFNMPSGTCRIAMTRGLPSMPIIKRDK